MTIFSMIMMATTFKMIMIDLEILNNFDYGDIHNGVMVTIFTYLNIYFSRLIPQVAENAAARALSEAKPLAWRRPT